MATKKSPKNTNQRSKTVRSKIASNRGVNKTRRLKSASASLKTSASSFLRREFYLPLPSNKLGRFLNKRRRLTPRYFREAGQELKQVEWPNRKETWKLTMAVFMFAIIFGLIVALVDFGLDKLFRKVILKS